MSIESEMHKRDRQISDLKLELGTVYGWLGDLMDENDRLRLALTCPAKSPSE